MYSLAEAYLPLKFESDRNIEILCTLRGSKQMPTRQRVQDWIAEYGVSREITNIVTKQLTKSSRTVVDKRYFQNMYNAKFIVTVNPAHWEGDFRLWEAMASGALIFVDRLFTPYQYPLLGGEHVIFYANNNKTDLYHKLDYYREHPTEARKIATQGYLHAMKYHRTINLADYVLRSLHLKMAMKHHPKTAKRVLNYTYTAQELLDYARELEPFYKSHPW